MNLYVVLTCYQQVEQSTIKFLKSYNINYFQKNYDLGRSPESLF